MITVALHTHTNGDREQDATKNSARTQALEDALRKEWTRADQGMNVCVHACMHGHVRAVYIRICILYIHIRIYILYVHYAYSTLGQTGILIPGKNETTIQIKFTTGKIPWQKEQAAYITAREPNCLWRIIDLSPVTNHNIMAAIVAPVKRHHSQTDTRIIPITVAKTLIPRHIEQRVANTHDPSADFPNISEHHYIPNKNLPNYFIREDSSFNMYRRPHNPDEPKTFLNIDPHHKISKNSGHIVLAMTRKPTPHIGSISMKHEHQSQPDRFVSDDEILALRNYIGHNPQTDQQHGNEVGSTNTISSQRYPNSYLQQYIRISRPAWNIFLKCSLCSAQRLIIQSPSTFTTHGTLLLNKTIMHCVPVLELVTSSTTEDPRDLNGHASEKPKHHPPIFTLHFHYKN
jgi:hypothetical protein